MALQLQAVVDALGGELHGDGSLAIDGLAPLESAGPRQIAFLSHPRYASQLAASQAACVIVAHAMREPAAQRGACILADSPYHYFARLTQLWKRHLGRAPRPGIHPSAVVDAEAVVDPSASIGPLCVVERVGTKGALAEL